MDSAEDIARRHDEHALGLRAPDPKVFVRSISVPTGLPWEQTKAATLEARHGAPLPLKDVTYRLRRLGSWKPGPGQFAAFYVRTDEFRASFETVVEVDGKVVTVRFLHPVEERERSRKAGVLVAASVGVAVVVAASLTSSLAVRAKTSARLEAAEQRVHDQLRAAKITHRRNEQSRRLEEAARGDRPVSDMLSDVSWISANKTSEAQIEAVHWDRGVLAIEARGAGPPLGLTDRLLVRSDKAVRPGVWLWGAAPAVAAVGPAASSQGAAGAGARP